VLLRYFSVLIGLLLCGRTLGAPTTRADSTDVGTLIQSLSNRDSNIRDRASGALVAQGQAVRPALLKIIRNGDPEQRSRAAQILLKLPWTSPSDPPEVEKYMSAYGDLDEEARKALVRELYEKLDASATLMRLLMEEPSDDVRWIIVSLLARNDDDLAMRKLREMDLSADDPPVLRLAGQAWIYHDREKSLNLLRRAIEVEAKHPTSDGVVLPNGRIEPQLDFAYDRLVDDAINNKRFDEAASWLRQEIPREVGVGASREALPRLVMLHAYFGPIKGVEDDLRNWGVNDASVRQVLAHVKVAVTGPATRAGFPKEALFAAVGLSVEERLSAASFLLQHSFLDAAEIELVSITAMKVEPAELRDQKEVKTQLIAWMLYGARNNDEKAADALQQAMVLMTRWNLRIPWRREDDLWGEIYWRRARAAKAKGDMALVKTNVANLLRYSLTSADTTIEIVNWLRDSGMTEEAHKVFENVYAQTRAKLDSSGKDPVLMNDLAWLCARCGERLDEAVKLSDQAVKARPMSAAFLDTAGEAYFRAGNRERAVELESKALQFRPLDDFMKSQLKRFENPSTTR
jgi:tetratricopeptide (TPR) repeat protein